MNSGHNAGKQGRWLEAQMENLLQMENYIEVDKSQVARAALLPIQIQVMSTLSGGSPCYVKQAQFAKSIYEVPWKIDFIVYHAALFPDGMLVEVKQQSVAGSVDEKYPFVVLSLRHNTPAKGAVFVGGGAVRACVEDWLLSQECADLLVITNDNQMRNVLKKGKKK